MLFSSTVFFFLFLPCTIFALYLINNKSIEIRFTFIAFVSIFFYGYYNPALILLLIISISTNYFFSLIISRFRNYYFLVVIIFIDLLLLFYFKYSYFFITGILNLSTLENTNVFWRYALPLGISFFTFQQIAYQVDLYKQKLHTRNFYEYFAYVSFFPQLIAGPIVKYQYFFNQINNKYFLKLNAENFSIGLCIFSIGLFKKIILADSIAHYVDLTYNNCFIVECSQTDFFITTFLYSFQIYFDFSAYSDMAIGIAKMIGVNLPVNFYSPYKAKSLIDFWRNWHITLSNFLRDYLYIPLGGNKGKTKLKKHRNLILTMVIGGIWHGAGFNFIIWGFIHGIGLTINHIFKNKNFIKLNTQISIFFTFLFVSITWIFFRSKSYGESIDFLKQIIYFSDVKPYIYRIDNLVYWMPLSLLSIIIIFIMPNSKEIADKYLKKIWYLKYLISMLLIFTLLNISRAKEFIYYEF